MIGAAAVAGGAVYLLTRPRGARGARGAAPGAPPRRIRADARAPSAPRPPWPRRRAAGLVRAAPRPAAVGRPRAPPRVRRPRGAGAGLVLHAISEQDGVPVAVVNDRVVREGDRFDGVRILRIGAAEVEVEVAAPAARCGSELSAATHLRGQTAAEPRRRCGRTWLSIPASRAASWPGWSSRTATTSPASAG